MNRPYINVILICVYLWYIPTKGPFCPVSLTWVLGICWIRTNLKIHEHSKLYKLSPIQKHQETNYPCHKNGQCQLRVIIWTKPQGMGIQPLGVICPWQHFKAFVIPIILYQFQKDPFCLIILYGIFISYMCRAYLALGQDETIIGDNFVDGSRKAFHFHHWLHVSNISYALWFYAHLFMIFYMYIALWRSQTTHQGQHLDVSSLWSFVQPLTS